MIGEDTSKHCVFFARTGPSPNIERFVIERFETLGCTSVDTRRGTRRKRAATESIAIFLYGSMELLHCRDSLPVNLGPDIEQHCKTRRNSGAL